MEKYIKKKTAELSLKGGLVLFKLKFLGMIDAYCLISRFKLFLNIIFLFDGISSGLIKSIDYQQAAITNIISRSAKNI